MQHDPSGLQAGASVLDAKAGLWSADSAVLSNVNGSYTVSHSSTTLVDDRFTTFFGPIPVYYQSLSSRSTSTSPTLSGRWNVFNLSSLHSPSAARQSSQAAHRSGSSSRNYLALAVHQRCHAVGPPSHWPEHAQHAR